MSFELNDKFVVLFNHFVDLTENFFKYFFLLSGLCLLEILVCFFFVVDFIKELFDIVSQIVQLLLLGFDTLNSFSELIKLLGVFIQELGNFDFGE